MKRTILLFIGLLFASSSLQLVAMEEEDVKKQASLNSQIHAAALEGDLAEVKRLVEQGAQMNAALDVAAYNGHSDICKFLIEKGADVIMNVFGNANVLERSVGSGHSDTVLALLVTLSPIEREKIVKDKDAFIACQLSMVRTKIVSKDVRKLITQCFVNDLVDQQMERIKGLIEAKHESNQNIYEFAKDLGQIEIVDLLDLENPKSYERIRRLVWSNVMRVLFGEPSRVKLQEKTTELSEDEAFGSWF